MSRRAVILSGSLGLGHDVMAGLLANSLATLGWQSRTLDCMTLLGGLESKAGDRVFRWLTRSPSVYDAIHFSHFRPGTRLAMAMDGAATKRLVPAVEAVLEEDRAGLLVSVFPTGASTAAKLSARSPELTTVVLCTDAAVHRFWAWPEIDLFLVTSEGAAASVRRYVPRARIAIVPPPVRRAFYEVPTQAEARNRIGVPDGEPCVLVMGGGWGLGPLAGAADALARTGTHVLAVAGRNHRLEARLVQMARQSRYIHAFGFTDKVPELMAAADLVVTIPGATTCSEARVVGRRLVLLDVVPGHGRENLQHELEMGEAEACDARPSDVAASVIAALDRVRRPPAPTTRSPAEWDQAFARALDGIPIAGATRWLGHDGDDEPPTAEHNGGQPPAPDTAAHVTARSNGRVGSPT